MAVIFAAVMAYVSEHDVEEYGWSVSGNREAPANIGKASGYYGGASFSWCESAGESRWQ